MDPTRIRDRHVPLLLLAIGLAAPLAVAQESIQLTGTIRDFQGSHPDFGSIERPGHVAGSVNMLLDAGGRPVYSGLGRKVTGQALDDLGRPVPPHLADPAEPIEDFVIEDGMVIPGTEFSAEVRILGAAITSGGDPVPVTTRFGANGDFFQPFGSYEGAVSGNVNDDENPRTYVLPGMFAAGTQISVSGSSWVLKNDNMPGHNDAHWEVYLSADSSIGSDHVVALRDGDTAPDMAGFEGQASVVEFLEDYIDGHTGQVTLESNQVIFLFELGTEDLTSSAADFQDLVALVTLATDPSYFVPPDDDGCFSPVLASAVLGDASVGAVSSANTFAQWFRTWPGINLAAAHTIHLRNDGTGHYEYDAVDFTPIDRKLYGNEGRDHNRFFTYQINARFDYEACAGQTFEFEGADDAWVFIDDELAIDLGGTGSHSEQLIELDRLNLEPGVHLLRIYYAHRVGDRAPFRIRTNIELRTNSAGEPGGVGFD